jgi:polyisoprenoid-binding protein YceI
VAGDIAVTAQGISLGELRLDARTLATDSANRNGAMQRFILKTTTAGNEYIVFKPTSGYAGTVSLGTPVSFDVAGDLTIAGVTKPAVFKVTATVTDTKVTGTATTRIKRSDFGLIIPNIPFVANVDDEFPVTLQIIADKVMQ